MTGGKGARSALAMDQNVFPFAVYHVALALGDVVADVVDQLQPRFRSENAPEGAAQKMKNRLPVGPGEIRRGAHGTQIGLAFGRLNRDASKLAIGQRDA